MGSWALLGSAPASSTDSVTDHADAEGHRSRSSREWDYIATLWILLTQHTKKQLNDLASTDTWRTKQFVIWLVGHWLVSDVTTYNIGPTSYTTTSPLSTTCQNSLSLPLNWQMRTSCSLLLRVGQYGYDSVGASVQLKPCIAFLSVSSIWNAPNEKWNPDRYTVQLSARAAAELAAKPFGRGTASTLHDTRTNAAVRVHVIWVAVSPSGVTCIRLSMHTAT